MQCLARFVVACTAAVIASPKVAIADEHAHPVPPTLEAGDHSGVEQALAREVASKSCSTSREGEP